VKGAESCGRCGAVRSAPGSVLCPICEDEFARALGCVAGVLVDLDVALSRQARIGDTSGRRSAETPLPLSLAASDAAADLGAVLRAARALIEAEKALRGRAQGIADDAAWLRRRRADLLARPDAAAVVDAVLRAIAHAVRTIDRPPASWYAGVCWAPLEGPGQLQCPADLYAPAGAVAITCRACGARHDAERRRAWLLEQVEDRLAPATLLARAISGLGANVNPGRIRAWAHRGRIVAHGIDPRGRPLYRVGDVLDALQQDLSSDKRGRTA
jgi:hypothetical protein